MFRGAVCYGVRFCHYKTRCNRYVHPWYIGNADLHGDLQMEMVTNEIENFAKEHEEGLHHVDVEAIHLLDSDELVRRLKKKTFYAGVVITKSRAH